MHYRWFAQSEVASGSSVQLSETWTVLEACHEHVFQYYAGEGSPANPPSSYATIRLVCEKLGSHLKAHVRIYKQIPAGGTEAESPAVRGQQAQTWDDPPELVALRALTREKSQITPRLLDSKITSQGESGLVPGGFLNYVVWEVVPGRRLASRITVEQNTFWNMEPDKRELIRQHFRKNYLFVPLWTSVLPSSMRFAS